jgi:SAM-dependent methyltransferase
MSVSNDFSGSADYYSNLISSKPELKKRINFVAKLLKKHNSKSVLDLGCGDGLYLLPLKKLKFDVEGLDIGKKILGEARKKSKSLKLYLQDMSKFKINKKYDSIICLNSSLVLLPNLKLIERTIKRCNMHLSEKGVLLLDLPNHKKEIKESNFEQSCESFKIPGGNIDVIYRDHKQGNKWITDCLGFVKKGNGFSQFKEHYEELIYSPKWLEKVLKSNGFKIVKIYGTRSGGSFDPNTSFRRFYLFQKE